MRLVRDIIVAVLGAVIVGLIVTFTTDLSQSELAWVYAGVLVLCLLILGGLRLPGMIRHRRESFKAEIIAAAKEQIVTELTSQVPPPRGSASPDAVLAALQVPSQADETTKLTGLLEEGRMLQGSLRQLDAPSIILPNDLAVEIGQWEGKARTSLVSKPDFLRDFQSAPGFDGFLLSGSESHSRLETQLAALEDAIRDLNKGKA